MNLYFRQLLFLILILTANCVLAQDSSSRTSFAPLDQWKNAISAGDAAALKQFYSAAPAAKVSTAAGDADAGVDITFWTGLKARSIALDVIQSEEPQPGLRQVVFEATVKTKPGAGAKTLYVQEAQIWQQQAGQWRIVVVKRSDATRLQQPTDSKDIYESGVDAKAEIQTALHRAHGAHKRVLLVFGANWCYDCHVLDLAFQRPDLAPVLQKNFEVVHVDVGKGDKNQDLMSLYGVPMARGIPGLAVVDSDGKLLYSQKNGEFEKARSLAPEDLAVFLNKWKPVAP